MRGNWASQSVLSPTSHGWGISGKLHLSTAGFFPATRRHELSFTCTDSWTQWWHYINKKHKIKTGRRGGCLSDSSEQDTHKCCGVVVMTAALLVFAQGAKIHRDKYNKLFLHLVFTSLVKPRKDFKVNGKQLSVVLLWSCFLLGTIWNVHKKRKYIPQKSQGTLLRQCPQVKKTLLL